MQGLSPHRTVGLVLLALLLLGGCRDTALEATGEEFGSGEMTVRFAQASQQGVPIQELGRFFVEMDDSIPLGNAAILEDVVLTRPAEVAFRRQGGDEGRQVIVYALIYEPARDAISRARMVRVVNQGGPPDFSPWLPGTGEPGTTGVLYAFFVEGVGEEPDAPVEISLRTNGVVQNVTLTPARHTLPARIALRVDKSDLRPLQRAGGVNRISFTFHVEGGDPRIRPLPLYAVLSDDGWRGGVGDGLNRFGFEYRHPLDRLDFLLLLLDL